MSYQNRYDLDIVDGNVSLYTILSALNKELFSDLFEAVDEFGCPNAWLDWDFEEDMKVLSRTYPNVVFQVTVIGELHDDIWRQYFKNGKSYRVDGNIVFPRYDKELLVNA